MQCALKLSDHERASAIWPMAAAACASSSLRLPAGSFSVARASAMAPDDTTSKSRFSLCSDAMSAASEISQSRFNAPAA